MHAPYVRHCLPHRPALSPAGHRGRGGVGNGDMGSRRPLTPSLAVCVSGQGPQAFLPGQQAAGSSAQADAHRESPGGALHAHAANQAPRLATCQGGIAGPWPGSTHPGSCATRKTCVPAALAPGPAGSQATTVANVEKCEQRQETCCSQNNTCTINQCPAGSHEPWRRLCAVVRPITFPSTRWVCRFQTLRSSQHQHECGPPFQLTFLSKVMLVGQLAGWLPLMLKGRSPWIVNRLLQSGGDALVRA